ncbi:hypothetical protein ACWD00_34775 [Streptomyces viridiviolaceus]
MTSPSTMWRWERWGTGGAVVLKRSLASYAVSRLAGELDRDKASWVAGILARIAASSLQPAAGKAFEVLVEACDDPRAAGNVIHQCLLQCGSGEVDDDKNWSSVAGPLLLGGSPPRLIRFLDHEPVADKPWNRPERIVEDLMMCVSFNSPRRPDLERFLSTTDQPLILEKLVELWRDDAFLPNRIVTDVTVANPHLVPPDSGKNVLLAVAKDQLDLLDFTQPGTVDAVVRGTRLPRADLADKYRRVLRALPPGVAQERLCEIAAFRLNGAEEAVAAALEAGYAPEEQGDRVVFFYLTEQWDRYDALDPDGELLYATYLDVHESADLGAGSLTWSILETARRNGRPDPAARYLEENPVSDSGESSGWRGSVGGYSSDYGSGGDYGGSGGWTGGSFHA